MGSITVAAIRGKLAAQLLEQIGQADYIEGLGDEIRELAEEHEDQNNEEIQAVLKLYDWLEKTRQEYIVLRDEVSAVLQSEEPEADTAFIDQAWKELRGRAPRTLREDFCGTAITAIDWVKRGSRNRAIGVDLDPDVLEVARKRIRSRLRTPARSRRGRGPQMRG